MQCRSQSQRPKAASENAVLLPWSFGASIRDELHSCDLCVVSVGAAFTLPGPSIIMLDRERPLFSWSEKCS
jgi:hypothetical protein